MKRSLLVVLIFLSSCQVTGGYQSREEAAEQSRHDQENKKVSEQKEKQDKASRDAECERLLAAKNTTASQYVSAVTTLAISYSSMNETPSDIADASIAKCSNRLSIYRDAMFDLAVFIYRGTGNPDESADKSATKLKSATREQAVAAVLDERLKAKANPQP